MAIDLTKLTILPQRQKEIITINVLQKSVLDYFQPHVGYVKGIATLRTYEASSELKECCSQRTGSGKFDEIQTPVVCLEDGNEFCAANLMEALNDFGFRVTGGNYTIDNQLIETFTAAQLASFTDAINKLVFFGDVDSANPNLNKLDGLIKKARANAPAANIINVTSGNVYDVLLTIVRSLDPDGYRLGGYDIFVPIEFATALQVAYIAMKYPVPDVNSGEYHEMAFPGFAGIRIIPTSGLNGENTIFISPRQNNHWLTNLEADKMTLNWDYNNYHKRHFWDIAMLLGVTNVIYDYVYVVTYDDSVLTAPAGIPVSIVYPLGPDGGVLTETAAAAGAIAPLSGAANLDNQNKDYLISELAAKVKELESKLNAQDSPDTDAETQEEAKPKQKSKKPKNSEPDAETQEEAKPEES